MRVRCCLLGVLGAALIAGCGGSPAPQAPQKPETGAAYARDARAIRTANHTYAKAILAGDAARACAVVTSSLVAQMQDAMANLGGGYIPSECPQLVKLVAREGTSLGKNVLRAYASSKVTNIRITGNVAGFKVVSSGAQAPGTAVRTGRGWKLSCCVGIGFQ